MNKQQEFEALAQEVREERRVASSGSNSSSHKQFLLGSILISIALVISAIILTK